MVRKVQKQRRQLPSAGT